MRLIAFFLLFCSAAPAALIRFEPAARVVPPGSVDVPVDVIVNLDAGESLLGFDLDLVIVGTGYLPGTPFPAIDPLFTPVAGVDGDGFAGLFFGPPPSVPAGPSEVRIATFAFTFPGSGFVGLAVQASGLGEELSGLDGPLAFVSQTAVIGTPEPAAGALVGGALLLLGIVRMRRQRR